MNFFLNQKKARRNTTLLAFFFLTAVLLITLAVDLVGFWVSRHLAPDITRFDQWLVSQQGLITSAAALGVMLIGSLARLIELAGGGEKVAQMVGAQLLDLSDPSLSTQRLRNIVEEMAIASGIPVPRLYIMSKETSINAFVAGYEPTEAVLVVTHGALEQLSRDELQGVIGHEFSHILNGDMRINVRLIALLSGILVIGKIGSFLLRSGSHSSSRRRSREAPALALVGLALLLIGYIGVFFGRLIKAAISRQRELLADASSVQFTRNPEGIGGALYKIGIQSSLLQHTMQAEDMNHLCFGETIKMRFSGLLASHPPIEARLAAIDQRLMALMRARYKYGSMGSMGSESLILTKSMGSESLILTKSMTLTPLILTPLASETIHHPKLSASVGQVSSASESYAQNILRQLPKHIHLTLSSTEGAVQVCYALLLAEMPAAHRQSAMESLPKTGAIAMQSVLLQDLSGHMAALGAAFRFPALELAMPALKGLSQTARESLLATLKQLINQDAKVTFFEFALHSFLSKHLAKKAAHARRVKFHSYAAVQENIAYLLWLVTRVAYPDETDRGEQVYLRAMGTFVKAPKRPSQTALNLAQVKETLHRLAALSPMLKPALIDACGDCILSNGKVEVREYELLRLIVDQLDCPMPPL